MKKVITIDPSNFNEKDLQNYSKMLNRYFKKRWRIMLFFLCVSCGVQQETSKGYFKKIPKEFQGSFYDNLETVGTFEAKVITKSFMKNLTSSNVNYNKPIIVKIQRNTLFIKFEDMDCKSYVMQFYGKRNKNKFVFYTHYKTVSVPLILVTKEMVKYKIKLTQNNEIVFTNNSENSAMLLVFGDGRSYDFEYQFKLLE